MKLPVNSMRVLARRYLLLAGLMTGVASFWCALGTVWPTWNFQLLDLFYQQAVRHGFGPPSSSRVFVGWQGGGCRGVGDCTVSSTANQIVTARFDRLAVSRRLVVQKQGGGNGTIRSDPTGIDCGSTCGADFSDNTVVTLRLEPGPDASFVGWAGGLCFGIEPCRLTMTEDRFIQALVNPNEPPSDE